MLNVGSNVVFTEIGIEDTSYFASREYTFGPLLFEIEQLFLDVDFE